MQGPHPAIQVERANQTIRIIYISLGRNTGEASGNKTLPEFYTSRKSHCISSF